MYKPRTHVATMDSTCMYTPFAEKAHTHLCAFYVPIRRILHRGHVCKCCEACMPAGCVWAHTRAYATVPTEDTCVNAVKRACRQAVSGCTPVHMPRCPQRGWLCAKPSACASPCDTHHARARASVHMHTCGAHGPSPWYTRHVLCMWPACIQNMRPTSGRHMQHAWPRQDTCMYTSRKYVCTWVT